MTEIVAGCLQWKVSPGDPELNASNVERSLPLLAAKRCQLLVLPEMWSSGFHYERLKEAAAATPGILTLVQEWCRRYALVITGSLPELDQGRLHNTHYVVDADGTVLGGYRKAHLFTLHGEHHHFTPGDRPFLCESKVGRLGVITCYDLRFPELTRRLALDGAEVLCVSAQWPLPRIEHWSLLLRARALENQMFAVGCNGCGFEAGLQYGGRSAIISPLGSLLAQGSGGEASVLARLDFQEMADFRKLIPCFQDRRPGLYGIP